MAVDDIQINLMILESILEDEYNVVLVTSGEEALARVVKEPYPDLILLDLSMPDMDGFELLERIRAIKEVNDVPVIFVTGEKDMYAEERGLALGAVDYIKKPFIPSVIRIKIHNHIELKTLRDDLAHQVAVRTKELLATHEAIILGMSLLSESRDKITGAHLKRIKNLTCILSKEISKKHKHLLDKYMAEQITTYSPLHDVGKVSVPDAVLSKQGGLTNEEFAQMKAHTLSGGGLLREIATFLPRSDHISVAIEIAEGHHERYNGTGYPRGLKGEEIPISARIVAVADVYDALRSHRPYKKGFDHQEAMDIILKGDGRTEPSHFDPIVLEAFEAVHEQLRDAFDNEPDGE